MLYVPAIVFLFGGRGPERGTEASIVWALLLLAGFGLAVHALLSAEPTFRVFALAVVTGALNAAAAFGVFFLIVVGGSCSDDGHIPAFAAVGAVAVYLGGASWGLQRSVRGVWAVPASLLLAGIWLVGAATILTGSTGACLD